MRELTAKQKTLLRRWFLESEPTQSERVLSGVINPLFSADQLTSEQWEELTRINDTEVLYQNVNRFLGDLAFKQIT